jgi:hypothetical protein
MPVGKHIGVYTPFTLDITSYIADKPFTIKVLDRDYTDTHHHQIGKQKLKPNGIFYTPQSASGRRFGLKRPKIISARENHPDFNDGGFRFELTFKTAADHRPVFFDEREISNHEFEQPSFCLKVNQRHEWTPEIPNLYQFVITYGDDELSPMQPCVRSNGRKRRMGPIVSFLTVNPI